MMSYMQAGSSPPTSLPNTVCLKLRWAALLKRMKNWLHQEAGERLRRPHHRTGTGKGLHS